MEALLIVPTRNTPAVNFGDISAPQGIVGNSMPENAGAFYAPVIEWMGKNLHAIEDGTNFRFSLPYFNSSSLKALYLVLLEIKKHVDTGRNFQVTWYVEDNDEFMVEAAETLHEMVGLPMNVTQGEPGQ